MMMRLTLVALILLVIGAFSLQGLVNGGPAVGRSQESQRASSPAQTAPTVVFDGRATQPINATLFAGGRQVLIKSVAFSGLNTAKKAAATADISLTQPATLTGSRATKWIAKGFTLRAPNRSWSPTVKISGRGRTRALTVTWKALPSNLFDGTGALRAAMPGLTPPVMIALKPEIPVGAMLGAIAPGAQEPAPPTVR